MDNNVLAPVLHLDDDEEYPTAVMVECCNRPPKAYYAAEFVGWLQGEINARCFALGLDFISHEELLARFNRDQQRGDIPF